MKSPLQWPVDLSSLDSMASCRLVISWMGKVILLRSKMEMRNRLLENKEKGYPCYKVAKNSVELCSHSSVLWKVVLVSYEIA